MRPVEDLSRLQISLIYYRHFLTNQLMNVVSCRDKLCLLMLYRAAKAMVQMTATMMIMMMMRRRMLLPMRAALWCPAQCKRLRCCCCSALDHLLCACNACNTHALLSSSSPQRSCTHHYHLYTHTSKVWASVHSGAVTLAQSRHLQFVTVMGMLLGDTG